MTPAPIPGVARVLERIAGACARSGRDVGAVRIVAAAKYVDAATVLGLVAAGIIDLGENRIDTLADHRVAVEQHLASSAGDGAAVPGRDVEGDTVPAVVAPRWHFIGHVQSRKVPELVPLVDVIHGISSVSAVSRLTRSVEAGAVLPSLLLQVNTAGDPAKDGLTPGEVAGFIESLPDVISIDGLMTMPEFAAEAEASRPAFAALRELAESLRGRVDGRHRLVELSMGTTQDFEVAVEEGATLVRLGRVLYAGAGDGDSAAGAD